MQNVTSSWVIESHLLHVLEVQAEWTELLGEETGVGNRALNHYILTRCWLQGFSPPNNLRRSFLATVSLSVGPSVDQSSPLAPYKGKLIRKLTLQECCRETFHTEWNRSAQRHCDSMMELISNTQAWSLPSQRKGWPPRQRPGKLPQGQLWGQWVGVADPQSAWESTS